jgi:2-polyprenyl-3-methyl-5-hydroxy-6-metoxy-1,4-benzoquinol methylase
MSKSDKVKELFNNTDIYLANDAVIRIRSEVIREMLQGKKFDKIIDIACGNAEISKQFLNKKNHLTLVDISQKMLYKATENIPVDFHPFINTICGNFDVIYLPPSHYDLIICTGLLAHVDNPTLTINKLSEIIKPGGTIILQNTNSSHPYSWSINLLKKLKWQLRHSGYLLNSLSDKKIIEKMKQLDLTLIYKYRSIVSLFTLGRFVDAKKKYNIIRGLFGSYNKKRMQFLGNDYIYYFTKKK